MYVKKAFISLTFNNAIYGNLVRNNSLSFAILLGYDIRSSRHHETVLTKNTGRYLLFCTLASCPSHVTSPLHQLTISDQFQTFLFDGQPSPPFILIHVPLSDSIGSRAVIAGSSRLRQNKPKAELGAGIRPTTQSQRVHFFLSCFLLSHRAGLSCFYSRVRCWIDIPSYLMDSDSVDNSPLPTQPGAEPRPREDANVAPAQADSKVGPIVFVDHTEKRFVFPFDRCRTWDVSVSF